MKLHRHLPFLSVFLLLAPVIRTEAQTERIQSSDLIRLREVGAVRLSPDGTRIAYTVVNNDGPGRPYPQIWIMSLADGKTAAIGGERAPAPSGGAVWSPDSQWLAYQGRVGDQAGLIVARADGAGARFLAAMSGTNSPIQSEGKSISWSPDSKQIAFVSATPGPETAEATGDPVVISRYLYKPDYSEGRTRFNDNRRLHIFVVDVAGGTVRQLTIGMHSEHSIDWSPKGDEILFVSSHEPNEDQFFNYDIFALKPADGSVRRLTATESAEHQPQWSPDGKKILFLGTKRGLTDLETTMEDTHVYIMNADGTGRVELGGVIDNRQEDAGWAPDGSGVYVAVQERGDSHLRRLPLAGGSGETIVSGAGLLFSWSVSKGGKLAYSFCTPTDLAELYLRTGAEPAKKLTDLNSGVLTGKQIAPVEALTFVSNDNRYEIEAFLTKPLGMTATSKHPLIVMIHGGPHGAQGPALNLKSQVYAARGWATLMVNYRGSTSYGQAFADAVFGDQNGNEAQDVLYGVSAALRRNLWIDRERIGCEGTSYGGQLTAWLITQTRLFKAAIPQAAITNLVSYNYMTYYNQYEQMEFGIFPHQGTLMDELWRRSALRYVAQVATPTLLIHGENDNDVPIAESEQFYIALKDVGVDAVMVRYPREGHGLREPKHVVDMIDRSIRWYEKYFPGGGAPRAAE
jgi:dipeptidyl aminopeptidase/acylaminoacyl peptidase